MMAAALICGLNVFSSCINNNDDNDHLWEYLDDDTFEMTQGKED